MKRQSTAKAAENRTRRVLRARFMAERGLICQVCGARPWCDMHEILKRSQGGSPTDEHNILCVCRPCHTRISDHPDWAKAAGHDRVRTAEEHAALRTKRV